jgi:hypothetical protein
MAVYWEMRSDELGCAIHRLLRFATLQAMGQRIDGYAMSPWSVQLAELAMSG